MAKPPTLVTLVVASPPPHYFKVLAGKGLYCGNKKFELVMATDGVIVLSYYSY